MAAKSSKLLLASHGYVTNFCTPQWQLGIILMFRAYYAEYMNPKPSTRNSEPEGNLHSTKSYKLTQDVQGLGFVPNVMTYQHQELGLFVNPVGKGDSILLQQTHRCPEISPYELESSSIPLNNPYYTPLSNPPYNFL